MRIFVEGSTIISYDIHLYRSNDHKQNFLDCIRTRAQTVAPAEFAHQLIASDYVGVISMRLEGKLKFLSIFSEN